MSYQRCFVPLCRRTSINSPHKVFITVPKGEKRLSWFASVGLKKDLSLKAFMSCCEDHFNLAEDVANFEWYQYTRSVGLAVRIQLKPDVLPRLVHVVMEDNEENAHIEEENSVVTLKENEEGMHVEVENIVENVPTEEANSDVVLEENEKDVHIEVANSDSTRPVKHVTFNEDEEDVHIEGANNDFTTQAKNCCSKSPALAFSKVRTVECIPTPPLEGNKKRRQPCEDDDLISEAATVSSDSPAVTIASVSTDQDFQVPHKLEQLGKMNLWLMGANMQCFLGLPQETKGLLDIMINSTGLSKEEIFLALRKIKLAESNERLGFYFNKTKSGVSRSLNQSIHLLAAYLQKFIFWPPSNVIQANVPNAFRAHYSKVQAIIDCFEIEIEKPSDAYNQAQTWSSYKNCNTMKYLISCTPDGFINFISKGYGGRTTDAFIVEKSKFLDHLRPNTLVMADRGFKHVDSLVHARECKLVRPPSVSADSVMTKEEVRETKTIASLRVHVERVIKRVRDFSFLAPHAAFHHDLLAIIDSVVLVACALINIQQPLFR